MGVLKTICWGWPQQWSSNLNPSNQDDRREPLATNRLFLPPEIKEILKARKSLKKN
jgi:hypothetical protein